MARIAAEAPLAWTSSAVITLCALLCRFATSLATSPSASSRQRTLGWLLVTVRYALLACQRDRSTLGRASRTARTKKKWGRPWLGGDPGRLEGKRATRGRLHRRHDRVRGSSDVISWRFRTLEPRYYLARRGFEAGEISALRSIVSASRPRPGARRGSASLWGCRGGVRALDPDRSAHAHERRARGRGTGDEETGPGCVHKSLQSFLPRSGKKALETAQLSCLSSSLASRGMASSTFFFAEPRSFS